MTTVTAPAPAPPHLRAGAVFARFLRFGALAFGGPVAQIGMLQRELVERERWISAEQFRRVFGLYQLLPGPEAHELCVYFGTVARGRLGGFLAGLGFMLPGLLLVLLASGSTCAWVRCPRQRRRCSPACTRPRSRSCCARPGTSASTRW
jgi:chromate transporter